MSDGLRKVRIESNAGQYSTVIEIDGRRILNVAAVRFQAEARNKYPSIMLEVIGDTFEFDGDGFVMADHVCPGCKQRLNA